MNATTWIAGADEVASETQISAGWCFAVLPGSAVSVIESAVAQGAAKTFHGKTFAKGQTAKYETFLTAVRGEILNHQGAFLAFTLQDLTWKNQFVPFAKRVISQAMQGAGIADPTAISIAEQLFAGLITLQRFTVNSALPSLNVEVDSDHISQRLATSTVSVASASIPTAKLLERAYEAHRIMQFPTSPPLGASGIRALDDAHSRVIQAADVFGNFALGYIFHKLGHPSKTRRIKAEILERVFATELSAGPIHTACSLAGPTNNDIRLTQPGGLTLRIG
jgi:hypothetical protein